MTAGVEEYRCKPGPFRAPKYFFGEFLFRECDSTSGLLKENRYLRF